MLKGNNNKVLLAALFLSVGAHASGLYLLLPSTANDSWVKPGQIQINIVASKTQHSNIKKNSREIKTQSKTNNIAHAVKDGRKIVSKFDQNNSGHTNNIQSSNVNKLTVQLRGKIRTALQKHLTYPPIARRRGWQGTVTIHVTIKSNGDLRQVKLSKSSGYSLLDNSAISALQKVGHLDELKPLLRGNTIPIELPIRYLLEDSKYGAPSV
jgi:TonB family protein